MPTARAKGRTASPDLPPAVFGRGSESGLFRADPVYALSGASLAKMAHHDTVHKAAVPVKEATVRKLPVEAAPVPKATVAAAPVPKATLHKLPVPTPPVKWRPAKADPPPASSRSGSEGGLFKMDPAYTFRGEMQAEKDPIPLPTSTPPTDKRSTQAAASVQKPALKKAKPTEPGPTPTASRSGPGSRPSRAGPASAVGAGRRPRRQP